MLQHGVLLSSSDSSHTAHDMALRSMSHKVNVTQQRHGTKVNVTQRQCHTAHDMAVRSMSHKVNVTQQRRGAKEDNLQ